MGVSEDESGFEPLVIRLAKALESHLREAAWTSGTAADYDLLTQAVRLRCAIETREYAGDRKEDTK